jgi:hypothetical protein
VLAVFTLVSLRTAGAQTIRGVTIDATTQLPISDVIVALLDSAGRDLAVRTRSNTNGTFVLLPKDPGRYRVMATRIGYQPMVTVLPSLKVAEVASVRITMATLAQVLPKVDVVERRRLTLSDLMSPLGFDLRRSKGLGHTLDSAQLNAEHLSTMQDMLDSHILPTVKIKGFGPDSAPVATILGCETNQVDIFLDGMLMSFGRDSIVAPRYGMVPKPRMRLTNPSIDGAIKGFAFIKSLPANTLYGIEVYNRFELPPPSLGGIIGVLDRCALVVWTKGYAERVAAAEAARASPGMETRIVWGTVIDPDTHTPVSDAELVLHGEAGQPIGGAGSVRSDGAGHFVLRANAVVPVRISVKRSGYQSIATSSFPVKAGEVVGVELAISRTRQQSAPLTIIARDLPVSVALTSFAGFGLRRQRAKNGVFLLQHDIAQRGARSILDLLGGIPGVTVTTAGAPSVRFSSRVGAEPRSAAGCTPVFVVDGARLEGAPAEVEKMNPIGRVRGIEIYPAMADVPPEFSKLVEECGAVLIWTG